MADPRAWQLIAAVQARLQGITVAAGYRTDIGTDVAVEFKQRDDAGEHIDIFTTDIKKGPGDNSTRRVRTLQLSIEPSVPITIGSDGSSNAHQRMHQIIGDIEDALVAPDAVSINGALDVRVSDIMVEDDPVGLQVIAAAVLVDVDYLP